MAAKLDNQRLNEVFQSRPDIIKGIQKEADSPARIKLFNEIASFIHEQVGDPTSSEPSHKRRRVDVQPSQNGTAASSTNGTAATSSVEDVAAEDTLLEIKDISVSIPQRKKFELCFTAKHIYARAPNTTAPVPGIVYAWKDIEYVFYLPVPEKQQVQHNYILFPRNSYLPTKNSATTADPLVFTVAAGAPKPGSIGGRNASAASAVSDSYATLFHWAINKCLQASHGGKVQVAAADPVRFRSVARQPHRPKEPAVHVKAFRGSKDGYLFFLEAGILWGFKKPLLFLPLDRIAAVSYTSVLQRTFNVVVEVFTEKGANNNDSKKVKKESNGETRGDEGGEGEEEEEEEETEEFEFAMLDQEDYAGINETYVARHGLQDRSLADQRKAKKQLLENAKKEASSKKDGGADGDANGHAGEEDDGLTELERAQREAELQLQDEEDEDEEDYDPGSEGESEGSGTSDDDDDDDDDDDEADDDEDGE
ncbi:hypothetical protein SLS62_009054 [Diatrype stigma]|uniref:Histone chaperone RTT106/FACT complex subunit SPT16-like middle domain-containing protein n=1 Tax=Diatrype stigma TaxID=117547 RepID=A0AAN9UIG9_9PEZI